MNRSSLFIFSASTVAVILLLSCLTSVVEAAKEMQKQKQQQEKLVMTDKQRDELRRWVLQVSSIYNNNKKKNGNDKSENPLLVFSNMTAQVGESELCKVCQDIVVDFIKFAVHDGCSKVRPVADKLCKFAKLLDKICADLLMDACSDLVELFIHHHISNPKQLCHDAHMCSRP